MIRQNNNNDSDNKNKNNEIQSDQFKNLLHFMIFKASQNYSKCQKVSQTFDNVGVL